MFDRGAHTAEALSLYGQLDGQPGAEPALALIRSTRGPLLPHERRELFEIISSLEREQVIRPLMQRPGAWRRVLKTPVPRYRRTVISERAEWIRIDEGAPARQLFVVLTTSEGGLFMSQNRLLTMLAELRSDVLWLGPADGEDYPSGVPGYADTFAALCARLREKRGLYAKTVAIGASIGGYSALRAATLASLDEAVSFSGRFSAKRWWLSRPQLGAFDPLCGCTEKRTRLTAYYAAGNAADATHAARLSRMCPSATLVPIEGHDHNVVAYLTAEKRLQAVFRDLAATPGADIAVAERHEGRARHKLPRRSRT